MDSRGTKTSVRVTSAGGVLVWVGDISSSVAPMLGWELRRGSVEKAGMGFGAMLEPDLLWRSLRVGLDCCLSLKAEINNVSLCACCPFTGCSVLPLQSKLKRSWNKYVLLTRVRRRWEFTLLWAVRALRSTQISPPSTQTLTIHSDKKKKNYSISILTSQTKLQMKHELGRFVWFLPRILKNTKF